jgi:hypothetical protein
LIATRVARRVRAVRDDGMDNSYPFGEARWSTVWGSSCPPTNEGMGAGYVDAVIKAVVKNVAVATRDLGESLETPHRK